MIHSLLVVAKSFSSQRNIGLPGSREDDAEFISIVAEHQPNIRVAVR
jgi:hypothetical protein